jgi:hypothetical protein
MAQLVPGCAKHQVTVIFHFFDCLLNWCSTHFQFHIKKAVVFSVSASAMVPKVCSGDPKGYASISQEIREYISVVAIFKYLYFYV